TQDATCAKRTVRDSLKVVSMSVTLSLTRAQMRDLDHRAIHEYGVPGEVLMENAGRGAAELLISLGIHGPVLICCGKGNNGGDGLVIARHLDLRGMPVRVLLFAKPKELTGEAAVNYRLLERAGLKNFRSLEDLGG